MVASSVGSVELPPPAERRRRFSFGRSDFQVLGVYLALALIWVILALRTQYFFTVPNIRNVLVQASTLSIIAAGLSIVLIAGEIDLAFATIQAFVGSIAAVLMVEAGFPWPVAMVRPSAPVSLPA
jgi:putative multiple sugar transport system permease protein